MKIKYINNYNKKKHMEPNSMPFHAFLRDHLQSTSGIICGSGSFAHAIQFGDHFWSGDHFRSGDHSTDQALLPNQVLFLALTATA